MDADELMRMGLRAGMSGYKVILQETLPRATMVVSKDIWDALRQYATGLVCTQTQVPTGGANAKDRG